MTRLTMTALAAALALSNAAHAQDRVPDEVQAHYDERAVAAAKAVNEEAGEVMSSGSPNNRAAAGFSTTNLQFTNEDGDTGVSLAFSLDMGSSSRKDAVTKNGQTTDVYRVSRQKLSVVLTAPIDSSTKATNLFSGDSLVTGTKGKISFSRFSTNLGDGAGARRMRGAAYRTCVERQSNIWSAGQTDRPAAETAKSKYLHKVEANLATADAAVAGNTVGMSYQKAITDPANQFRDVGSFVTKACVPSGDDGYALGSELDLFEKYDDPTAFAAAFFPDRSGISFWGFDGSVGRNDHTYLDRAKFKLPSAPRTSWEVGAYAGWIAADLDFSLRGRAVFGQSYKDNDEAEICRTVSIPAGPECIKGPDGPPLRQRSVVLSVESRKLFTVNGDTQIAIAPQITYKTEDNNVGVEVPIYLVPDKDGKLSGGLKAVYNSKGDEFAVGVFVGVPFSIFY